MKFITSGKNIEITNALRERVEDKLGKFGKFFNEDTEVHTTLSVEKTRQIVEVTIPFKGMIFRVEQVNDDMYAAIDKAVDVLERQIIKNRTKLSKRFKEDAQKFENIMLSSNEHIEEEPHNIIKVKKFQMKPMTQEEAVLQMNLLGHDFYLFRNSDTSSINVVYKRKDGNYGVIETDEQ